VPDWQVNQTVRLKGEQLDISRTTARAEMAAQ
jgi:hypothetical protein